MQSKRQFGFTLVELLVALAIVVLVSGALATLFRDVFRTNELLRDSFFIEREIAATIGDAIQEIRSAGSSSTGGYVIEKAEPFSLAIYTNVDQDQEKERVHYFLSGTALKKSVVDPVGSPLTYATTTANEFLKTVVSDVIASSTAPLFSYFDATYAGTSTPMATPITIVDVRLIRMRIVVDADAGDGVPPLTATSEVNIRNVKYAQ